MQTMDDGPDGLDPEMRAKLAVFGAATGERDPQAASQGRAAFLQQAASLAAEGPHPAARRLGGRWHWPRLALTLLFVAVLGMGTVGAAAQASLPGDALYGVKIASETALLNVERRGVRQVSLQVAIAGRRLDELASLPDSATRAETATRYGQQLEMALRRAAVLPNPELRAALAQVQAQLLTQQPRLAQLSGEIGDEVRQMAQAYGALAAQGIRDPNELRLRLRGHLPMFEGVPPLTAVPATLGRPTNQATPAPHTAAPSPQGPRRTPWVGTPSGAGGGGLVGTAGPRATARQATAAARQATAGSQGTAGPHGTPGARIPTGPGGSGGNNDGGGRDAGGGNDAGGGRDSGGSGGGGGGHP